MSAQNKISILPGTSVTPHLMLAELLSQSSEIEKAVIVVQKKGKDEALTIRWTSEMSIKDLAYAATCLQGAVIEMANDDEGG